MKVCVSVYASGCVACGEVSESKVKGCEMSDVIVYKYTLPWEFLVKTMGEGDSKNSTIHWGA